MSASTRLLPIVALLLAACSDGSHNDTATQPGVGLATPERLLQSRAVDRSSLRPEVQLSTGQSVPMRRVDDTLWSGTVRVPPGIQVGVNVTWFSDRATGPLPLARLSKQLVIGAGGSALSASAGEYLIDFDSDDDGIGNLEELEQGRDPLISGTGDVDPGQLDPDGSDGSDEPDAGQPDDASRDPDVDGPRDDDVVDDNGDVPDSNVLTPAPAPDTGPDPVPPSAVNVDVYVPRIAGKAPKIDGKKVEIDSAGRFSGEWAGAVQVDSSGVSLGINQLMIDQGAEAPSGTPYRKWAAMHDGSWLYVVIMVEDNGARFGDSDLFWQDDGVELYIDGDYGRAKSYGDDDDYHLIVPLLEPGTTRNPNSDDKAGFMYGPFSSQAPIDLQFETGPGIGPDGIQRPRFERDVYEFRIALDSIGVVPGQPFGFELQVNDDDDGGPRDSKWGWAHPARQGEDIDFTYVDPSFMNTMLLD